MLPLFYLVLYRNKKLLYIYFLKNFKELLYRCKKIIMYLTIFFTTVTF